jgi:hypothetical protein
VKGNKELVCELKKSLNGLKQSPRAWYQKFDTYILGVGFSRRKFDHYVYSKQVGDHLIYVVLYVDDMFLTRSMIHVDIGGHPPIPTSSSCLFFVQHVLLYCFVIVGSTLLGLSEAPHILQVDTGGLSPNPAGLFCMFSCQHILLYFPDRFGALNIVFLARHSQNVDGVRF